jgi:hypothetical protein
MAKLARKSSCANAFSVAGALSIVEARKVASFFVAELSFPAGIATTDARRLLLSMEAFFVEFVQSTVCAVNAKRTIASSIYELAASAEVISSDETNEDQKN